MHERPLARRFAVLTIAALLTASGLSAAAADGDSVLKPEKPLAGRATLIDLGVQQLERLPWDTYLVRFNLHTELPVSVSAVYLMRDHLLVLSASGTVYCLDRRNLEARWITTLRNRLVRPPTEGAEHYVFLTKDDRGGTWVEAYSRRNGSVGPNFPRLLPYGTSGGPAAAGGMAYIPSLGQPRNLKTVESVNLLSGRPGWGYNGSGLVVGDAKVDPDGKLLVVVGDNGLVTALATGSTAPSEENWMVELSGAVDTTPEVTPDQVVVGTWDGLLYNLNLLSGEVNWMRGLEAPIRKTCPWVIGGVEIRKVSSGVEGAADIEVQRYEGIAFARNRLGLHALDLRSGTTLFLDPKGGRPILRNGRWIVVRHRDGTVTLRDSTDGYAVKARLDLSAFALVPTNRSSGALFAVTHDGGVVAALPK